MRILLAEDEKPLADWLVKALGQNDFVVDWVDNGRLVLNQLQAAARTRERDRWPRREPDVSRLLTSMYLGDRWEYLFESGDLRLRAFGHELREPGTEHWVELPAQACWAYAG